MNQIKIKQKRNLIVLGRTGVGKSTVVNQILGKTVFQVSTSEEGVTRGRRTSEEETEKEAKDVKEEVAYKIKIIDTVGLQDKDTKRGKEIEKEIQDYLSRKAPEGVNLFLFVMRKGVFSEEEKAVFDSIIASFEKNVGQHSALIITGCEGLSEEGRKEEIIGIKEGQKTKSLTDFMGKNVHAVGFPDVKDVLAELKEVYEKGIKTDAEELRKIILSSGDRVMTLQQDKLGKKSDNKTLILASCIITGIMIVGLIWVGLDNAKGYFHSGLDEAKDGTKEL